MFYENSSIFGSLRNNIAASMANSIYATARTSDFGNFNSTLGLNEQQKTGKNHSIICGMFDFQQKDNDFYCN